ncbi:hypothetical protein FOC1_g10013391 [Fusarium oxysporum f. sp. cubense race 1]|uniref:Uncharacterized protein n=1 Tax=Fusarium oxysporum f. sp. cubense (strain race 1) TaxID=1229664 RepID=N4UVC6_FUSC1|nr:hypothetical protein FOC1_g10013391 [Fusarium oxysporum f. sp. cubense race 1]
MTSLKEHFERWGTGEEAGEAGRVDNPFVRGLYDTWGETQLRTKVRSHREIGRRFYGEVYERYIKDS